MALDVALIAALIVLNAAFAGTEMALVSLRDWQIRRLEHEGARGRRVARLAQDPSRRRSWPPRPRRDRRGAARTGRRAAGVQPPATRHHQRGAGDLDDASAVVHLRDLVDFDGTVAERARPALILPESVGVLKALRVMQHERHSLALVISEYGVFEGIVAVEDLVEELVGEIFDETDRDLQAAQQLPDGSWILVGSFPIHDLVDLGSTSPKATTTPPSPASSSTAWATSHEPASRWRSTDGASAFSPSKGTPSPGCGCRRMTRARAEAAEFGADLEPSPRLGRRMILREPTRKGDKAKVTFVLPTDDKPGDVFVVGDFNSWTPGETMLRRRGDVRSASLTLSTGRRYAFRYYRDGRWFNDDHADGYEPNEYGERNCIIDLTETAGR